MFGTLSFQDKFWMFEWRLSNCRSRSYSCNRIQSISEGTLSTYHTCFSTSLKLVDFNYPCMEILCCIWFPCEWQRGDFLVQIYRRVCHILFDLQSPSNFLKPCSCLRNLQWWLMLRLPQTSLLISHLWWEAQLIPPIWNNHNQFYHSSSEQIPQSECLKSLLWYASCHCVNGLGSNLGMSLISLSI